MKANASEGAKSAVLLDLDGVFYEDNDVVPGGADTLRWLQDQGIPFLFVSNTSSRPRFEIVEKLAQFGITCEVDGIISPPVLAAQWIRDHDAAPAALFVPRATECEFRGLEILPHDAEQGANSIVIGDLGEGWSFSNLNRAFRLLVNQPSAQLVALGMSRYWNAADGLRLDAGPFVRALEYAAGREALVLGKPDPGFFRAALAIIGADPSRATMIGDDIVGDVRGAQEAGLRGVLVRTGKFRPPDLELEITPDGIVDSIAEIPSWWCGQGSR